MSLRKVKSTGYFSMRTLVQFLAPSWSSELSVAPIPGDLTPSHRYAYKQNTNAHQINEFFEKEKNTS